MCIHNLLYYTRYQVACKSIFWGEFRCWIQFTWKFWKCKLYTNGKDVSHKKNSLPIKDVISKINIQSSILTFEAIFKNINTKGKQIMHTLTDSSTKDLYFLYQITGLKSVIKEPPTKVIVWGRITSKVVLSWDKIFYTSTGWGWRGKEGCYQNKLGLVSNPHHHWEYFVLALAT